MHITLNKFLQELESLSPSAFSQIENLYPLEFNVEISSLAKFSISLNHEKQTFNFFENLNPSFSLQLNIFTVLNALNKKQIPTKSISGDAEIALILLGAIANIDIDLELLVYKYFGDIPALILRKVIATHSQSKESSVQENEAYKILESFRDISIRLDRLEHVLINQ
jgi:ubiquinone biosynthesis protein UbiJ